MRLPKLTEWMGFTKPKDIQNKPLTAVDVDNLPRKEIYFAWEALPAIERKSINAKFMRTFTIIGIVVALLLVIMQEFFVIIVVASLIFFTQAVVRFTPEKIKLELSNHGIMYGDKMYYWQEFKQFFFTFTNGVEVLAVDTYAMIPGRLFLNFDQADKAKIKEILEEHVHFLADAPKTVFDKAYDRVMDRFDFSSSSPVPLATDQAVTPEVLQPKVTEPNVSEEPLANEQPRV